MSLSGIVALGIFFSSLKSLFLCLWRNGRGLVGALEVQEERVCHWSMSKKKGPGSRYGCWRSGSSGNSSRQVQRRVGGGSPRKAVCKV
ncbi:hypothetical protein J3E72DRAFT_47145 [Bipolaris maydis]|uniref:uncharacterized protein n=1 Tax=Cochliobolus heterostrophus TaxID=5016 RepID=UPI0024D4DE0C|nr:hypothetical protein J3E73DRAFT_49495 [Bipolaris maydis]KAJ6196845.1 hypothetical protein J3E72DRAFT_47145 [Bipolaris maydis]KAJ6207736.1 hypothetical protein PSV09DRAFT_2047262 [Bipolaris maydis]KAJ6269623.1 hypothetical protein PSV08DRAFT_47553 [Bipolaris maydis]KAJ6280564.1 hypothetical protein J3E71DRAFT_47447 [Bipolaris maydis]